MRRDQGHRRADPDSQPPRQALAERDPVIAEFGERTADDMIGDQRAVAEVVGADAADDRARGGAALAGRHDLALDQWGRADDPRHLPNLGRDRVEIAQHPGLAIDSEMAVETEDAADQIGAEAVHDRHDDDQGGDAERDAEQREDGDNRDEAFLPPRPQIAERDHPFKSAEDHVTP